ncbi:uncharacterized protein [Montipora capricornis]|uniref:uncharacterized protein n=1 Tax=Montipora capricornis TaxID=246305 RepID=UPI0035F18BB2
MKIIVACFTFLYLLKESYGDKICTYTTYSYSSHGSVVSSYRCSMTEYCCSYHRCCTYAYARWYLWFILVVFGFGVFLAWWYYRHRYLPGRRISGVQRSAMQVTQGGPAIIADGRVNVIRVTAPQPMYPQGGPVAVIPGGTRVPYAAYPPPLFGQVQKYQTPPPPYTSIVKHGTTSTTTTIQ